MAVFGLVLAFLLSLAGWVQWGAWPNPKPAPVFADADAIVILGGGDPARSRQGLVMAAAFPNLPLIVTGDSGAIVTVLIESGIVRERIVHEEFAISTVENAKFTAPILEQMGARRVILVTSWYHVPRTLGVFRKFQPNREFVVSFSAKPDPLTTGDRLSQRHERLAAVYNLFVYGVWSF